MARHWARKEAQRNEVAVFVEKLLAWSLSHKEAALGIGLCCFVSFLLGLYIIVRYSDTRKKAWEDLAVAENLAYSGQIDNSQKQLQSLAQQFSRSDAAAFGSLFAGDLSYRSGSFTDAAKSYQAVITDNRPQALIPFALASLSAAQETAGNFAEAISTAQRFLQDYPEHVMAPQVHITLARSLLALGRREEAKTVLEKITLLYADTPWAQMASQHLVEFQPAGPKP